MSRKPSRKRTYIITYGRITSGDELTQRNGLTGLGDEASTYPFLLATRCIWFDRVLRR